MIRIRPGVIITHICNESILVAALEARCYCPYTTILNDTGEMVFSGLKEGKSIAEIKQELTESFNIPADIDIEVLIKDYINQLAECGYILSEEDLNQ